MIILHAAPVTWRSPNGVTPAVQGLVAAQNALPGCRAGLLITSRDAGALPPLEFPVFQVGERRGLSRARPADDLPEPFRRPDLVVFHSTFVPLHAVLAARRRALGVPYLVCPHGGMTAEALRQKAWKKRLGRLWFFDELIRHAAAIQYSTHREREKSGDWGRPVIIAGNGVHPPAENQIARPGLRPARRFLFLGRLHIQHKGLDLLLEACRKVKEHLLRRGVEVVLVGPDVNGSRRFLENRIRAMDLGMLVRLRDAAVGDEKRRWFQSADLFVHPSRTEGQPAAVLEAMSFGLPVLVTPGTNVAEEVVTEGAGWETSCDPNELARDLRNLAELPGSALARAGCAARNWVLRELTWDRAAARTVSKYQRVLQLARAA
ncbi:MAG: glycosyltransferase [Thermogutta sp.]|nr:glycosyltransferase [Thermogutta sp.]